MSNDNLLYFTPRSEPPAPRPQCCDKREPLIMADQLCVSYGAAPALRNITLPIARGCVTAIVGPSGCGKSSFLNCMNRMTDLIPGCSVSGTLSYRGQDLVNDRVDLLALRRRIGMIFQKPNPFPLSIRKNLTLPLKHHGMARRGGLQDQVESILQQVGLWDEVKDRLDHPALALSGGQQQRLCLARALVLEPEVILLDEPCSALDPIASGVVEDLIASLRGQYTVVIVTHNLAQARRIADDVAMFWMQDGAGTLVEHGPVEAMFESPASDLTAAYISGSRG